MPYRGDPDTRTVTGKGRFLNLSLSRRLYNHSPDGFNWGYGGSGPAQLALALLLDVTGDSDLALRLHQKFKRDIVALWPTDRPWEITSERIRDWVEANRGAPIGEENLA